MVQQSRELTVKRAILIEEYEGGLYGLLVDDKAEGFFATSTTIADRVRELLGATCEVAKRRPGRPRVRKPVLAEGAE